MSQVCKRLFAPLILLVVLAACGGGGGRSSTPQPPSTTPTITAISPTHAGPGTLVSITGTNLGSPLAVYFNNKLAYSFTAVSATEVDAVVPAGASTGTISVTASGGIATSPTFTVDLPLSPTVTSFTPTTLSPGSTVTVTGTHFLAVTQVQFAGVNAAAFTVSSDTQLQATAPGSLSAGVITITSPGGTGTSSAYTFSSTTQAQVILNTGFESTTPLAWQGDTAVIQPAPGTSAPAVVPHAGTKMAYLGDYGIVKSDQIYQDLYVPATATAATATFYVKIITTETGTTAVDTLTVAALTTANATLGTLLTKSNLNAADFTAYAVDLLPYKGQTIRLSFKSMEDAQRATAFILDDVTVFITVPTAGDLKPIVTAFTPTSGVHGEQLVQLTGKNFFGTTGVSIGGVTASFTLTDGTSLSATVPATATSGTAPITVTNAQGAGSSAANFSVIYGAPTVTAMNPTQGPVGTPVVLSGSSLGYAGTTLTLNGVPITGFTQSYNQLSFTLPAGATTGSVVVTTQGGSSAPRTFTLNVAASTLDLHADRVQVTQSKIGRAHV